MSAEENKAVARRVYEEIFNQQNLDLIDQLLSANFVEHEEAPGVPPTREGVKQFFAMFVQAFPDLKMRAEDLIAEGDMVAARYTMTGTHQGEFMGIPPTGKSVTVNGIDIVRFSDGKVAEHWGVSDQMSMMQQLGVMPEA